MNQSVAPQFVPWLRTGLANEIAVTAVEGMALGDAATLTAKVRLRSIGPDVADHVDPISGPPIALLGPGHVLGLDRNQIVRCDPVPGAVDAEPDYLVCVELAAADLPWRFTPAAPDADDRLQPWLVLVVVPERAGIALARGADGHEVLTVDDPAGELPNLAQSWAWAHVHADVDSATGDLAAAYAASPEQFRARLICPRRLEPDRRWIAAIVPAFEAGRAAGLRAAPIPGQLLAWSDQSAATSGGVTLPVYSSWRFRTGSAGDFESLVRKLAPHPLARSAGRRRLDLSAPGGGLPSIDGAAATFVGALVAPGGPRAEPAGTAVVRLQDELAQTIAHTRVRRIPADYVATRDDPVVGPAVIAARQAGTTDVPDLGDPPRWLAQLNLDLAERAVAGLGGEVVRRDQEAIVAQAWAQAAAVRPANDVLARARVAWEIASRAIARVHVLADATLLQLAGPAAGRIRRDAHTTMHAAASSDGLPGGLLSAEFRRRCAATPALAPRSGAGRRPPTAQITSQCLAGPAAFVAAWTRGVPLDGADVLHAVQRADEVAFVQTEVLGRPASAVRTPAPVARAAAAAPRVPSTPAEPGVASPAEPGVPGIPTVPTVPGASRPLAERVRRALDPLATITAMVDARVVGLAADRPHPVPAGHVVQPTFSTPMYERLVRLNPEFLMPGVGEIPDNSVALAAVNQEFVEAFLAGVNHETGREFLWREFPASLDGTWFRRFWNSVDGSSDISPIRTWAAPTALGEHRPPKSIEPGLVLLVTGDLLRRYPATKVYAVPATWAGNTAPRQEDVGPTAEVKMPIFTGSLGPGVQFFGFDLDVRVARGSTRQADGEPGYFFVFEEQPGAPRFGLDAADADLAGTTPQQWSELSWSHLAGSGKRPPRFVDLDANRRLARAVDGTWGDNAAAMAAITLQQPVRMLVHADALLPSAHGGT